MDKFDGGCIGIGCLCFVVIAFLLHPIVGIGLIIAAIALWVANNNSDNKTSTTPKPSHDERQPHSNTTKTNNLVNTPTIKQIQHIDSSSRLTITKNLFPAKKENSESFRQLLISHGIRYFYHFTDESNLDSIRKYGGLLSWKSCNTYGVDIPSPGGDLQSRQLDMKYDLQDYVRLSFCEDHPMAYRHKKDGKRLVLLKIKTDVALWERTLFSDINATDSNHHVGGTLYDLKRVNFVAVKKTYVSRDDNDFKHHQAEILVKTVIPKEFIVNLDDPEYIR